MCGVTSRSFRLYMIDEINSEDMADDVSVTDRFAC